MRAVRIAVTLLLAFAGAARAECNDAAAEAFAAALERGSLGSFCTFGLEPSDFASERFADVRDLFENTASAGIGEVACDPPSASDGGSRIRVRLTGAALARDERREVVTIPPVWWLTLRGGRLVAAETEASVAARELLGGARPELRGAELTAVARLLARRPIDFARAERWTAAAQWLRDAAEAESNAAASAYAVTTLARIARGENDADEALCLTDEWLHRHGAEPIEIAAPVLHEVMLAADTSDRTRAEAMWTLLDAELERLPDRSLAIDIAADETLTALDRVALAEARQSTARLADVSQRFGLSRGAVMAKICEGLADRTLHEDDAAYRSFTAAAELASQTDDHYGFAEALFWLARTVGRKGEWREALRMLAVAGDVMPAEAVDERAKLLTETAIVACGHDLQLAGQSAEELVRIGRSVELPGSRRDVWIAIGQVRNAQKRYADAVAAWKESLREGAGTILWAAWSTKSLMAHALHALGEDEEALAALRESIELIEARQALVPMTPIVAVHYFHDKAGPYLQYADLLAEVGRPREALEVLERAHGRALLDLLRASKTEPPRSAAERDRERQLQTEIVARNRSVVTATAAGRRAARQALEAARLELERFEETLAIEHADAVLQARPGVTRSVEKARVPRGMAVVEYAVFGDHVRIFVTTRAADGALRVRSRSVPVAYDELRPLVERLAHRIDARAFDYAADARQLYRLLIAPIEPLIASSPELCIVPDGVLWLVPFPMLEDTRGEPLLGRATILVAPSIAMLDVAARSSRAPVRSVLALGGGTGIAGGAAALPEADDEAAAIAALYPRRELLTNAQATEAAAKRDAARYDVLHFATHAVAQTDSPMYSALLLAAGDGNDGRLEAWEVAQLKLHASVAVLSACDTGSGSVYYGEGIVGLSWAFLLAGCRTTIVSQWRVRSDAAAALMTDFHRRLRAGRSPAAALREAALALRARPAYRHPADWAAFLAVGAP